MGLNCYWQGWGGYKRRAGGSEEGRTVGGDVVAARLAAGQDIVDVANWDWGAGHIVEVVVVLVGGRPGRQCLDSWVVVRDRGRSGWGRNIWR